MLCLPVATHVFVMFILNLIKRAIVSMSRIISILRFYCFFGCHPKWKIKKTQLQSLTCLVRHVLSLKTVVTITTYEWLMLQWVCRPFIITRLREASHVLHYAVVTILCLVTVRKGLYQWDRVIHFGVCIWIITPMSVWNIERRLT